MNYKMYTIIIIASIAVALAIYFLLPKFLLKEVGDVLRDERHKNDNPMYSYKPEEVYSNPVSIKIAKAIQDKDQGTLKELLKSGDADLTDRGIKDMPLIVWAASHGNMQAVRELVNAGAPVNDTFTADNYKYNLVGMAVRSENSEFLKILLDAGANPNGVEGTEAPLFTTLHEKRWDRFDLLIEKGADINKTDEAGVSVLMESAYVREYGQTLKLLKMGADPKHKSNIGISIVDIIKKYPLDPSSEKGKEQKAVIDFLKLE